MTDPRNHEAISPDLAGYALDALEDEERDLVEAHLTECAECTSELEELMEGAASLAFAVPPVAPPAALADRINTVIDAEIALATPETITPPAFTMAPPRRTPWYASPRLAWGVSSGLAAAFVGVVAIAAVTGIQLNDRVDELEAQVAIQDSNINTVSASLTGMELDAERALDDEVQQVSLLQESADTLEQQVNDLRWLQYVTSTGAWSTPSFFSGGQQPQAPQGMLITHASGEEALLMVNGLAPAPVGMEYQVWLTYEGIVIPGRTFTVDRNGYAVVKLDLSGDATEYIGASVTVEPVGGSVLPSDLVVLEGTPQ
ncbi:MAG: anti-sigma factor [Chloroflexi bacterium]|jgi:uncharacterized coiled-coil protein SlyX|nr:anti-sigma factor [Chloroflexota bacterium]MBT4513808.1 anti-sigma factor [Chloroflexota bacterium]MBT6680743.1 anti-sigma factor [Chloroflexota bacterium]